MSWSIVRYLILLVWVFGAGWSWRDMKEEIEEWFPKCVFTVLWPGLTLVLVIEWIEKNGIPTLKALKKRIIERDRIKREKHADKYL